MTKDQKDDRAARAKRLREQIAALTHPRGGSPSELPTGKPAPQPRNLRDIVHERMAALDKKKKGEGR